MKACLQIGEELDQYIWTNLNALIPGDADVKSENILVGQLPSIPTPLSHARSLFFLHTTATQARFLARMLPLSSTRLSILQEGKGATRGCLVKDIG